MYRRLCHISSIQIPHFTYYVFCCIISLGVGGCADVQAQSRYNCTLSISSKFFQTKTNANKQNQWTVFVEKFANGRVVGLLGKQQLNSKVSNKSLKELVFTTNTEQAIQLRFVSPQNPLKAYTHIFNIAKDSTKTDDSKTMRLGANAQATIVLQKHLLKPTQTGAQRYWLDINSRASIQGALGVRVNVHYVLPPGIQKGKGYVRGLIKKRYRLIPLVLYSVKHHRLVNDLLLNFTSDTLKFTIFIPFHELPVWDSKLELQLIHADEACLLQRFLVKYTPEYTNIGEVQGQIKIFSVRKHQASGVSFGLNLQTPQFYAKYFAYGMLHLDFFGRTEGVDVFWCDRRFNAKQLQGWNNEVFLENVFVPYAALAKRGDTVNLELKVSLYSGGLNNTLFYTGYPRHQSRRIMKDTTTKKVILPAMCSFKIRPVFFKLRRKQRKEQPIKHMLRLRIRIQKHMLYQTKWQSYRKKLRFGKDSKDILRLVKNDQIVLEVIDSGYPKQVLFSTSVICTNEILRQKFWKLKDKYGNYLKIAVQKLTTKKDKFLHTNGKKETKTLGGRR